LYKVQNKRAENIIPHRQDRSKDEAKGLTDDSSPKII